MDLWWVITEHINDAALKFKYLEKFTLFLPLGVSFCKKCTCTYYQCLCTYHQYICSNAVVFLNQVAVSLESSNHIKCYGFPWCDCLLLSKNHTVVYYCALQKLSCIMLVHMYYYQCTCTYYQGICSNAVVYFYKIC